MSPKLDGQKRGDEEERCTNNPMNGRAGLVSTLFNKPMSLILLRWKADKLIDW